MSLASFVCIPTPWLGYCRPPDYNCGGQKDNKKEVMLIKELEVLQEGKMGAGQPQAYNCEL